MHPQRPLPLHRRLKRPLTRSFFAVRRRAQQCRARKQSAAVLPSLAPHEVRRGCNMNRLAGTRGEATYTAPDSAGRAALQVPICQCAGSRGKTPRPFSRGFKGDTLFREREYPPLSVQRQALQLPSAQRAEPSPFPCLGKQKAPAGRGEGFLLCCVCIFRREKITSGGVPLCKY